MSDPTDDGGLAVPDSFADEVFTVMLNASGLTTMRLPYSDDVTYRLWMSSPSDQWWRVARPWQHVLRERIRHAWAALRGDYSECED